MQTIDDFFSSVANLPSLPKVVQEVMLMLNGDNVDVHRLSSTIEQDAVIAAKVLKMANSSFYGVTRAVKSIDDAVAILGLSKLRTLVVACGVTSAVHHVHGFDLKRFWTHSLVAAGVSRDIAKQLGRDVEVAYLAGLLHNIGDLLLHLAMPVKASEIETACIDSSAEKRRLVELDMIGLDHCQIGEALALRWGFPREISRALRYYAMPLDKQACAISPVVYAAVHVAHGVVHGDAGVEIADTLNVDVAKLLNLHGEDWLLSIAQYRALLAEASTMI